MITKRLVSWFIALTVPTDWRDLRAKHSRGLIEAVGGVCLVVACGLLDLRLGLVALGAILIAWANFGGNSDAGTG